MIYFYASPDGTGDGSASSPGSLDTVKSLVRANASTDDVTVYLHGGVYRISTPLEFTALDSGSNGHKVLWRSNSIDELPIISGGVPVTGWTLHDGALNIWKANVPQDSRQFYVDGQRAIRARSADRLGFATTDGTVGHYFASTNVTVPVFSRPQDIQLVYRHYNPYGDWCQDFLGIVAASRVGDTTTLTADDAYLHTGQEGAGQVSGWGQYPEWLENAYEFLTQPGYWYLDRDTLTLYYVPRPGEDMATAEAILPISEGIIKGTLSSPLTDVEFTGICFEHSGWLKPNVDHCFIEQQSNVYRDKALGWTADAYGVVPAAVELPGAKRVKFTRNVLRHLGGQGVAVGAESQECVIKSNIIMDASGCAIRVGDPIFGTRHSSTFNPLIPVQDNVIRSNYIHHTSQEYAGGAAIHVGIVRRTKILYNFVTDVPYTGLSLGWDWVGSPTIAGQNEIGWNKLVNVMKWMQDGAPIYTLGEQGTNGDTSIHDNYLFSGQPFNNEYVSAALYFDQGSRHIVATDNVCISPASLWWCQFNTDAAYNTVSRSYALNGKINRFGGTLDDWGDPITSWYNTVEDAVIVGSETDPATWPAQAQAIVNASGLEAADADLLAWSGGAIFSEIPVWTEAPTVNAIPSPTDAEPIIITGVVPSYLGGSLAVACSTSANLIVPKPLAGSLLSSVSLASSIVVPKPLAAALSIAATTSADLTVEVPLDVTTMPFVNAITSPTNDNPIIITGYVPGGVLELAGTLYAQTTLEGSLTVLKPLFGSININTSIYGDLTVTPASFLSGVVGIQVSSSGSLSVPKPLAGQISISVNVLHHMKTVRFRVKSVIKDVASDFSVPITIQKP